MKIIMTFLSVFVVANAGVNQIYNALGKKEGIKQSNRYEAYINKKSPNKRIIKDKKNKNSLNINLDDYEKMAIYEDNGTYLFPTGKYKIKTYLNPNDFKTKEDIQEIFGFSKCGTYNRETYECFVLNNDFYLKILKNKREIQRFHRIMIDIEYVYVFK